MALKLRLTRKGSKKRAYYHVVVANSRAPRDGKFIEKVGSYNPLLGKDNPDRFKIDADRVRHWLSKGAQPTDRIALLLAKLGLMEKPQFNNPEKAQPKAKAQERAKERAEKAAAAAEAAAAPAAPAAEESAGEATA